MKVIEPRAMKEIHEIRIKLHDEDKDLSIKQKVQKTNRIAQEFLKKIGLEHRIVVKSKFFKQA